MAVFDWIRFLTENGIPYKDSNTSNQTSAGWVSFSCPFHHDSTQDHLGVHLQSGAINCWRCNGHGLIETLTAMLHIPQNDAIVIARKYQTTAPSGGKIIRSHKVAGTLGYLPTTPPSTKAELSYIKKRKLTNAVEAYDIRGGGICGEWAFRIVIPIYCNGVIVSATGRAIHPEMELRYKTFSPAKELIHHKQVLLGEDFVPDKSQIIVVEGALDAVRAGPGFVSTFGTSVTEEQVLRLSMYENIILLFDNDEPGKKALDKLGGRMALLGKNVEGVYWDSKEKDIMDLSDDELLDLRQQLGV